jgi:serine/threonine protein phosphatase PrpC
MEDGVFCDVFDGHDRCGQLVSKLARDHLPFMILSQRNALLLGSDDDDGDGDDTAFSDVSPQRAIIAVAGAGAGSDAGGVTGGLRQHVRDHGQGARGPVQGGLGLQRHHGRVRHQAGEDLVVAKLGDSRAMLATVSEMGYLKAVQLTTDQKPNVPRESS